MHRRNEEKWPWPRPSRRVRELIRRGAELVLHAPEAWIDEIHSATLSTASMAPIAEDPVLSASIRRTNRANLAHWARANVRDPGAPVGANLGAEPLGIARDLVRRGVSDAALQAYRTGQNAAWLRWMQIAFALTSDHDELRELLDVTARSVAAFIDAMIAEVTAQMAAERDELTRGTHAERREVIALLLEGAPLDREQASRRLGYRLDQPHTAAVVWSDEPDADFGALEATADALGRDAGGRPLTVAATAASLWVWVPTRDERALAARARAASRQARVALGSSGEGVAGFRQSHLDALTTQRLVARLGASERVVRYEDVRLVALVTRDPDSAANFVKQTLGALATAGPELAASLLVFLKEGCNASAAAKTLRTHRNTLLRRLAKAEELLPRPLADARIDVAVALEALRWQRAR